MASARRVRWVAVAAAALGAVAPAAAVAQQKIGYFDIKRILTEVDEARAAKTRLQKEFDDKQKQLDTAKAELEKMQKDFQAKQAVLSQAARDQMAMEMQAKLLNANKLFQDLQGELAQKEQAALGDLIQKLEPVVRELADEEGYAYVFEKNDAGMFIAPAGHDLTAQLIRRYNQRYPGGKAPAPKPAEKAPAPKSDKK